MHLFNLLPESIKSDVLTCLPAESVLECKLVSKTWKNLIQHPLFSKMHTNRLVNNYASNYSNDSSNFLALTSMDLLYYLEYIIENHEIRIRRVSLTPPFKCKTFVGSVNGLICLRGRQKESFCVYNPMTKEYVILPEPKINLRRCRERCKDRWVGFGYVPSNNEYKVVLMYKVPKSVVVMVYTLGSGSGWRSIGKFDLKFNYVFEGHGTFANGALHWMHPRNKMILVFNLADEKFRDHLSPPPVPTSSSVDFGVLGGFLFCARRWYDPDDKKKYLCSDLWTYKEQGGHRSFGWNQEFIAVCDMPLALTKSGGVLNYGPGCLNIYDRPTFTPKRLVNELGFRRIFSHQNSFVSLKDLGEEGAKVMQPVTPEKRKRCD